MDNVVLHQKEHQNYGSTGPKSKTKNMLKKYLFIYCQDIKLIIRDEYNWI